MSEINDKMMQYALKIGGEVSTDDRTVSWPSAKVTPRIDFISSGPIIIDEQFGTIESRFTRGELVALVDIIRMVTTPKPESEKIAKEVKGWVKYIVMDDTDIRKFFIFSASGTIALINRSGLSMFELRGVERS